MLAWRLAFRTTKEDKMSIISKIKSLLPASSRSLHGMYREVVSVKNDTKGLLREVKRANDALFEQSKIISEILSELKKPDSLDKKFDAFEFQASTILWDLYRREDESLSEAKLRFFRSLPAAEGVLRSHQLELVELLKDFDKLCKENDIRYFLAVGTLLGAIRHNGFVPWDDDIDVGMLNEDIDRLKKVVSESDEFEITDILDQYVFCRQVRFKRKGAGDNTPFIDLFIYEYSSSKTPDDLRRVKEVRQELIEEFEEVDENGNLRYPLKVLVNPDDRETYESIANEFELYRNKLFDEGLYCKEPEANSIIWSIENLSYGDPVHIIPIEYFNEMRTCAFEDGVYPILGNSEQLLTQHYKDWLSVPTDIKTHYKHIAL